MAPLTEGRNTPEALGPVRQGLVAAATTIFPGAFVMLNAAGFIVEGQTAAGLIGLGRAEQLVDNAAGADGAETLDYKPGIFRFANSAGADEVGAEDVGKLAYAVDDQTVALTDGTGARSPAGTVEYVDAQGVWVRFDAALTRTAAA